MVAAAVAALAAAPGWARQAGRSPGTIIAQQLLFNDCPTSHGECGGRFQLWDAPRATGPLRRAAPLGARGRLTLSLRPAPSPDGRWLLFASRRGRVAVQRIDWRRKRPIGPVRELPLGKTDGGVQAMWSPGGTAIVLAGLVEAHRGIWIIHRDGRGLRQLVTSRQVDIKADDRIPAVAWSARDVIAFTGRPVRTREEVDDPGSAVPAQRLYVVGVDGSGLRQLSHPSPAGGDYDPAWSPDGRRLAFVRSAEETRTGFDPSGEGRLMIADIARRRSRPLPVSGGRPAWSPDGRELAYVAPDEPHRLGIVGVDGRLRRRVTGSRGFAVVGSVVGIVWLRV
jgi:TolB protein